MAVVYCLTKTATAKEPQFNLVVTIDHVEATDIPVKSYSGVIRCCIWMA